MTYVLHWTTILSSSDPKFLVKGHELSQALYGPNSRFAIIEVRTYDKDRFGGVRYRVRDAVTVSDADVRKGKRPAIVHECPTLDQAVAWCDQKVKDENGYRLSPSRTRAGQ